ncbi:MAG: hypothetical protein ACNI3A_01120 [Desulfovibrio sp.]|uniref:hypothetical protein n=1 Tax=Desulfovibrio sp. 7SRBS1 TaxID=3378064 RepID=UPI003B3C82F5
MTPFQAIMRKTAHFDLSANRPFNGSPGDQPRPLVPAGWKQPVNFGRFLLMPGERSSVKVLKCTEDDLQSRLGTLHRHVEQYKTVPRTKQIARGTPFFSNFD